MLGLFDSGTGGLNTVRYIKKNAKSIDLCYLLDRGRAPYGIKSEKELIRITDENIKRLRDMGAERVLIACCTASTVHRLLPSDSAEISLPIISEISKRARNSTRLGRIGVIATNHTVDTHVFKSELEGFEVYEHALPQLVTMIDAGLSDTDISEKDTEKIQTMLEPVLNKRIDTLILGCTHFPAVIKTVEAIAKPYGVKHVIDSAKAGAELLIKESRKLKRK